MYRFLFRDIVGNIRHRIILSRPHGRSSLPCRSRKPAWNPTHWQVCQCVVKQILKNNTRAGMISTKKDPRIAAASNPATARSTSATTGSSSPWTSYPYPIFKVIAPGVLQQLYCVIRFHGVPACCLTYEHSCVDAWGLGSLEGAVCGFLTL